MGSIVSVKCQNQDCGYDTTLGVGPGMRLFYQVEDVEKGLRNGTIDNPEALKYLQETNGISCMGVYVCPKCRKLMSDEAMYFVLRRPADEPPGTRPDGRPNFYTLGKNGIRFEVVFPFGQPVCDFCRSELEPFPLRSPDAKCPKCGGKLTVKDSGMYD